MALLPQSRRLMLPLLAPLLAACSPTGLATALTPRAGTTLCEGLAYGEGPRRRLDLYSPAGAPADAPLLVFFYGGAWQTGRREEYGFLGRTLAARGMRVAVPDYRVWPEARWPDFLQDAAAAVAWLRREVPARTVLMGHSAGGFLAGALALDPRWLGAEGRAALAGCITLAAPFEWTPEDQPLASIFAAAPGGAIRAAPEEAALATAPPMLLLHGEDDTTVRPEQSRRMAARLQATGARRVETRFYPGVGHIGIMAGFAGAVRALGLAGAPVVADVGAFVREVA